MFFSASLAILVIGCKCPAVHPRDYQGNLSKSLLTLGHWNWIVVADSAYPMQTSPGIKTIYTGGHQLDVLAAVLKDLGNAGHVAPIVHLDAELDHVPENLATGVTEYRNDLQRLLQDRPIQRAPHSEIIASLDKAGQTFEILVLKTDSKIPYTSVFLELDCGYWGPRQEQQLRQLMR